MRYVYVAGPYTKPAPTHNVRAAIAAADRLLEANVFPFVPHLSHLWDTVSPKYYETWMRLDFAWIVRCDALVRLSGESAGADREVTAAQRAGLPVFYGVDEFLAALELERQAQGAAK